MITQAWTLAALLLLAMPGQWRERNDKREAEPVATEHVWNSGTGAWDSAASWRSGQVPGAGGNDTDTAMLDGRYSQALVSSGLVPGGNAIHRVITGPNYTGDVGLPGSPLTLNIPSSSNTQARFIHHGSGTVYYKGITTFTDIVCDSPNLLEAMVLSGDLRHVFVLSGTVLITDAVTAISSLTVVGQDARVVFADSAQITPLLMKILGGNVVNHRATGSGVIEISAGHLTQIGKIVDGTDLMMHGGSVYYAPTVDISADNPDIWVLAGRLDLSALDNVLEATDLVIGPDAEVIGDLIGTGRLSGLTIDIDLRERNP